MQYTRQSEKMPTVIEVRFDSRVTPMDFTHDTRICVLFGTKCHQLFPEPNQVDFVAKCNQTSLIFSLT